MRTRLLFFRITLIVLVAFGLWSAGRLSLAHLRTGATCPILVDLVPACFVAFAGYLAMALAGAARLAGLRRGPNPMFWIGLVISGGLALIGSLLEAVHGDICPRAFGDVPLCYLSFAFGCVIALCTIKLGSARAAGEHAE